MASETPQLESFLRVGMSVIAYLDPLRESGPMYKAYVRGWEEGDYVLFELPEVDDRRVEVSTGLGLTVKFRHEGETWSFDSTVGRIWAELESPHFRVRWPGSVGRVSVRKSERIDTAVACNVITEDGAWMKGQIRDLGAGGCRLCLKLPAEEGSRVHLSFTLPDGTTLEDVRSVVRKVSPFGKGALIGCQFEAVEELAIREVDLFVSSALQEGRRQTSGPAKRVLIIEEDLKRSAGLRRSLERRGFDVATAGNLIDGFAMLRALLPHALMVNCEQHPLSGFDVCRIVRGIPGFRKVPLFLYGRDSKEFERQAAHAGATGYIPFLRSARRLVDSAFLSMPEDRIVALDGLGGHGRARRAAGEAQAQ